MVCLLNHLTELLLTDAIKRGFLLGWLRSESLKVGQHRVELSLEVIEEWLIRVRLLHLGTALLVTLLRTAALNLLRDRHLRLLRLVVLDPVVGQVLVEHVRHGLHQLKNPQEFNFLEDVGLFKTFINCDLFLVVLPELVCEANFSILGVRIRQALILKVVLGEVVDKTASAGATQEVVPFDRHFVPILDRLTALSRHQLKDLLSVRLHVVADYVHSFLEIVWSLLKVDQY